MSGTRVVTNQEVVPQPMFPKVVVAVASEQGRRDENQDWLSWTQTPHGELFVIADGMGGYKGGALAAKMTVDMVEQAVSEAPQEWTFGKAVTEALSLANSEVYRLAHVGNADTENMGSTALVVLLSNGYAHIAHVGDSRAYLLRNSNLQLLTRDHTRVQQMIDAKMLTREQARNHPDGHLLSRAIGSRAEVEVEISGPVPLKKGDALLLCSDGLSGFVTDEEIRKTLKQQSDVQRVPQALVNLALSAGGNDNITIQFVQVDGTVRERETAQMPIATVLGQGRSRSSVMLAKRGLLVFVAIAAILVVAVTARVALTPPAIASFIYDPDARALKWDTQGADSVDIQPSIGTTGVKGQAAVTPANTPVTYTATATAKRLMVWTVTSPPVTVVVPAASSGPPAKPLPAPTPPATSTPTEQEAGSNAAPKTTPQQKEATSPAPPAGPRGGATGRGSDQNKGAAPSPGKPTDSKPGRQGDTTSPSAPTGALPTGDPALASTGEHPAPDAAEASRQGQEPAANTLPGQPHERRK